MTLLLFSLSLTNIHTFTHLASLVSDVNRYSSRQVGHAHGTVGCVYVLSSSTTPTHRLNFELIGIQAGVARARLGC